MSDHKASAIHYVQTVPVRMTVDVQRSKPDHPILAEEPVVVVRGVIDLSPDPTVRALPIWFVATVQLYADGMAEIQSFQPAYGSIQGTDKDRLMGIYEHAFARALVDTKLKIIGVRS